MKTAVKIFVFALIVCCLTSCEKEHHEIDGNQSVEQYIEALRSGEYDHNSLPEFSYKDIPALLKYRNDKQVITKFPRNPISSYSMMECTLGLFVLWTIESIRAVSIDSPNLIMNFPSQNPILVIRHTGDLQMVTDEASHELVAKAYYDWWNSNKKKAFRRFSNTDPLKETEYRWK